MWINTLIEDQWEELSQLPPQERYAMPGFAILYQDVDLQGSPQPQEGAMGQASQMPSFYRTVHKAALLEIILDERKPWGMRQICLERWGIYDQLERSLNDPTGQTMMPPEVLGIPPDKIQMLMAQMSPPTGMPGAAAGPGSAGGVGGPTPPAGPATSPAPESSGTGVPVAQMQQKPALGQFGSIERQAVGGQQQS